jgi:hypothetical protein
VKLDFSFGQEAGTERGGSDVWLQLELTNEADPGTEEEAAEKAGRAFDQWVEDAPYVEDGRFRDDDDDVDVPVDKANCDVWVEEEQVRTRSDGHYDYEVKKPLAEARDLVCKLAAVGVRRTPVRYDEAEWTFSLRTLKYVLKARLFRDGNAE